MLGSAVRQGMDRNERSSGGYFNQLIGGNGAGGTLAYVFPR